MMTPPGGGFFVFFAQGNAEVLVWDIKALLLVERIEVASPVVHLAMVRGSLFCALEDGTIAEVDPVHFVVSRVLDSLRGRKIRLIAQFMKKLYAVVDDGQLFLWGKEGTPAAIRGGGDDLGFILHPVVDRGIRIARDSRNVSLTRANGGDEINISASTEEVKCCCFDDMKPLCAIGYIDGAIAVWRVPI
jgi:hypothetical protein